MKLRNIFQLKTNLTNKVLDLSLKYWHCSEWGTNILIYKIIKVSNNHLLLLSHKLEAKKLKQKGIQNKTTTNEKNDESVRKLRHADDAQHARCNYLENGRQLKPSQGCDLTTTDIKIKIRL